MKYSFIVCLLICCSYIVFGQTKQNINLELLGSGGLYSFNYENQTIEIFTLRGGLSYLPTSQSYADEGEGFRLILGVSKLLNISDNSEIELGVTSTLRVNDGYLYYGGNLGYRFTPVKNGLIYKINLYPLFNNRGILNPWIGIGIGYQF